MNNSFSPESLISGHREMAVQKLLQGCKFTTQLQNLMNDKTHFIKNEFDQDSDLVFDDLISKISDTFTDTIAILNNSDETDEVSLDLAASSLCDGEDRKSEGSGNSGRSRISARKDRRGCYKRRKGANSWTRYTPTFINDGHAWRKYGQKAILNAKHPRSYFRCTYKYDQGCQASKQVQKTEDTEKPMYMTTYIGQHTCKSSQQTPQIIFDPAAHKISQSSSFYLDFGPNITEKKNEYPNSLIPSSSCSSVKNEKAQGSNFLGSLDLTNLETSGHLSSTFGSSDYGDAISERRSYGNNVDFDFMVGLSDFDAAEFGLGY